MNGKQRRKITWKHIMFIALVWFAFTTVRDCTKRETRETIERMEWRVENLSEEEREEMRKITEDMLIALAANLKSEEREEFADLLEKSEERGYLSEKEYNRFFMYFKIAKKRCPKESYARKVFEDFETKCLNRLLKK